MWLPKKGLWVMSKCGKLTVTMQNIQCDLVKLALWPLERLLKVNPLQSSVLHIGRVNPKRNTLRSGHNDIQQFKVTINNKLLYTTHLAFEHVAKEVLPKFEQYWIWSMNYVKMWMKMPLELWNHPYGGGVRGLDLSSFERTRLKDDFINFQSYCWIL